MIYQPCSFSKRRDTDNKSHFVQYKKPGYEHWLGATNDVNYYVDAGDGVVRYFDWGTFVLNFDATWDSWSGGPLDGTVPTVGTGLLDFGGGNSMNENLFVVVENDGTMGYYNMDTGIYSPGHNATYGSWTTFDEGPLSGLTLTALNANAVGTHNGLPIVFWEPLKKECISMSTSSSLNPQPRCWLCAARACWSAAAAPEPKFLVFA